MYAIISIQYLLLILSPTSEFVAVGVLTNASHRVICAIYSLFFTWTPRGKLRVQHSISLINNNNNNKRLFGCVWFCGI